MSTQDPSRVNTTSGIASPPAVPTPGHDGLDALVALIFRELRSMAHRHLVRDADHATLQTTELVHEAYLRLVGHPEVAGRGRAYFFASAARAMRQVLVDASRRRNAGKRGDGVAALSLDDQSAMVDAFSHELLDLDDALRNLEARDARAARVVECRFFAGMSVEDTAIALGVSPRTVKADWATARMWLRNALHDSTSDALAPAIDGDPLSLIPLDIARAAALLDMRASSDDIVTIERYDMIRQLGRGSTGAVFLARDRERDRELGRGMMGSCSSRWNTSTVSRCARDSPKAPCRCLLRSPSPSTSLTGCV